MVGQAIPSTGTEGHDALGSASTTITRVGGEDSDGGVEGSQGDSEEVDGDRTDSSNVNGGDGGAVSDGVEN